MYKIRIIVSTSQGLNMIMNVKYRAAQSKNWEGGGKVATAIRCERNQEAGRKVTFSQPKKGLAF